MRNKFFDIYQTTSAPAPNLQEPGSGLELGNLSSLGWYSEETPLIYRMAEQGAMARRIERW